MCAKVMERQQENYFNIITSVEFERLFKYNENNLNSKGKYKRIDKVSDINKMLIKLKIHCDN